MRSPRGTGLRVSWSAREPRNGQCWGAGSRELPGSRDAVDGSSWRAGAPGYGVAGVSGEELPGSRRTEGPGNWDTGRWKSRDQRSWAPGERGRWVMEELGTGERSSRGGVAVSGVEFPGSWDAGLWGIRDQRSQAHRESEYRIPEEPGSAELNFPGAGIPRMGEPGSAEPSPRGAVARGGEGLSGVQGSRDARVPSARDGGDGFPGSWGTGLWRRWGQRR